jgi:hypothetical protein
MKLNDITDSTMFTDKLTIKEFCTKLRFCNLAVSRVERMVGVTNGTLWRKMRTEPWNQYFAREYPEKFGNKKAIPSTKKDFISVTEIPCMVDGCTRMARVEHETGKPLPRGMKKRCSVHANSVSGAGFHDNYRV